MGKILIIDDEHLFAETVADKLATLHHTSVCVDTLQGGIKEARQGDYDVIFLDVYLPDGNGLDHIKAFKSLPSEPQIIIITGQGTPDGAELAIKHGAWCYLEKKTIIREVGLALTRALQYREVIQNQQSTFRMVEREQLVGESPAFLESLELLGKAGATGANILITGDSGTGKEAFARAIHKNSIRSKNNFVVVDCAALPEQLVESVLFGHVKGAFTGADKASRGLVKHADNGTLFLDEIGDLPLSIQKNFLRVLQERRFCPVGSHDEQQSDFRLIAATNQNLEMMVQNNLFREDLFHRLRVMHIHLPPLKDRTGDVALLANHFLQLLCQRYGQQKKQYGNEFVDHLTKYSWPGNVRELSHAMESAFAEAAHSDMLFPQHLPVHIRAAYARSNVQREERSNKTSLVERKESTPIRPWREAREAFEQEYLQGLLTDTNGNIQQAGRVSGLSRTRIYQLIKKHNIPA